MEFGDYEEDLPISFLGGADENVDDKRDVTDFWAKLNQVLVDAGSDLHAREIQAKISTPQDTLDARRDMTKAKLDVMRLPPRRPKNQIRDSDLPSDIEWVRHIFTGWRTHLTCWRSTATVHRLQRRDKTKKHTEQAQRTSDGWDQRDFRTVWSAAIGDRLWVRCVITLRRNMG